MSSAPGESATIDAVAPVRASTPTRRRLLRLEVIHELLWTGDRLFDLHDASAHASFAAWCDARPGRSCRLWIGSEGLVELLCDPALALDNPVRRVAWARRQLVHYHGAAAQDWRIAGWRCRAGLGASALRHPGDGAWMGPAIGAGVRVRGLHALWPLLLAAAVRERPALRGAAHARVALLEATSAAPAAGVVLTLFDLQRGRLVALHRRRVAAGDELAFAEAWSDATAARADGAVAAAGDGIDPGAGHRRPTAPTPEAGLWITLGPVDDAAAGRVPCARWLQPVRWPLPTPAGLLRVGDSAVTFLPEAAARDGWWAMAAATLLLVGAAWDATAAWQQRASARSQALLPVAAAPAATTVGTTTTSRTRPEADTSPRGADAAARPADGLGYRWDEVFRASELAAGAGRVHWLALEHARGGSLQLQGLARDADAPRQAVALVRRELGPHRAALARLEPAGGSTRFELRIQPDVGTDGHVRGPQ